jgi:nucleoside-triphosphatase THEP1
MRCTIITGARDAGKTATAARLAASLREQGVKVCGVISEATVQEGVKVGYTYLDLATGKRAEYARRKTGPVPPGERGFDFLDDGMAFGCAAIRAAAADGADALFIDEIGPLEMGGDGLWPAIQEALKTIRGQVILTVRPSLVDALCARVQPLAESIRIVPAEKART